MKITSPSPAWRRFAACALVGLAAAAHAQNPTATADIPATKFVRPTDRYDYVKREVMIPMRDGVKLFTSIVIPKGAKDAPVIMTRTPYNAAGRTTRNRSARMLDTLPEGDEVFVRDGYIRIFQDVRGKYGSEGEYWMTRPLRGPLNPTPVDHTTNAWDTIEWLVKNLPESNGRIGMLGSSYEGFTVVMALVNPHPALKVAAPMSPMVDGWMGYADLTLAVLLAGLAKGWRAEELQRPLQRLAAHDRDGQLRRTLAAWFAHDMKTAPSAAALHVHRNTLDYRLRRIAELTGLDLARLDDCLLLFIGLALVEDAEL